MATAAQVRTVATDMQSKIAAFKVSLDALNTIVSAWVIDEEDANLPADEVVKAQLIAYEAMAKPAINMNEALAAIREAT